MTSTDSISLLSLQNFATSHSLEATQIPRQEEYGDSDLNETKRSINGHILTLLITGPFVTALLLSHCQRDLLARDPQPTQPLGPALAQQHPCVLTSTTASTPACTRRSSRYLSSSWVPIAAPHSSCFLESFEARG